MKGTAKKSRSQRFLWLCLSPVFATLALDGSATASNRPEGLTATAVSPPQLYFPFEEPKLPPLGDPSLYLPEVTQSLRLEIDLSDRLVYVYENEEVIASYPIAVGKAGWETPIGEHEVIDMLEDPAWEHPWTGEVVPPGPNNPLGNRWIGFWTDGKNFIGFHGTPAEHLVGQAVSHGCIRMRNDDILALYAKVTVGTTVTVKP